MQDDRVNPNSSCARMRRTRGRRASIPPSPSAEITVCAPAPRPAWPGARPLFFRRLPSFVGSLAREPLKLSARASSSSSRETIGVWSQTIGIWSQTIGVWSRRGVWSQTIGVFFRRRLACFERAFSSRRRLPPFPVRSSSRRRVPPRGFRQQGGESPPARRARAPSRPGERPVRLNPGCGVSRRRSRSRFRRFRPPRARLVRRQS